MEDGLGANTDSDNITNINRRKINGRFISDPDNRIPKPETTRLCRYSILSVAFAAAVVIGAATLQGLDVVNHVALARPGSLAGCRTWMAGLEGSPGLRTPCNPSVGGRPQEVHFVVDGIRVCGEVERRSERTADRG